MKSKITTALLLSALCLTPLVRAVDAPPGPPPHKEHGEKDRPDTELEKTMKKMSRAQRELRGQISDSSKKDENIALLEVIKKGAEASKKLIPMKTETLPEADRADFLKKYQEAMDKFIAKIDETIAAVSAGDGEKAAGLLRDLGYARKSGHQDFQLEED